MNRNGREVSALLYVQHLLGIGHLARMSRIAVALRDNGVRCTLVRGGMPLSGFDLAGVDTVQLDPVRADPDALNQLIGVGGEVFGKGRQASRRDHLLRLVAEKKPDIIVVEAFPFGRRAMRFEIEPMLEMARGAGVKVIAASVRDILQEPRRPERAEETARAIERWFDLVLVHGDEAHTPLMATFPMARRIAAKTVYTGLVAAAPPGKAITGHDVIVSVGGGAVGGGVLEAAISASRLDGLADKRWLLLAGPNMAEDTFRGLAAACPGHVEMQRFVSNLPARLAGARLSVSQAGYNTVSDILVAGCAAVLVPFEAGGETEQGTRARMMEERGLAVMLSESAMSGAALANACAKALAMPARARAIGLNGAGTTATILLDALAKADAGAQAEKSPEMEHKLSRTCHATGLGGSLAPLST